MQFQQHNKENVKEFDYKKSQVLARIDLIVV